MTALLPYEVASSKVGMSETNAALKDFLYTGGQNLDPATRAWCADFVNASLRDSGLPGTNSGMARSFLKYGQPVDTPQKGDIAVFSRGDPNGPYGHVGFYEGEDPNGIRVLGGNQGNTVASAVYPRDRLLGFRRPGEATDAQAQPTQMAAYPWTPGQQQAQSQPAPETQQQPAPQQMASYAPQQHAPSFEELGKILGLNDPPPLTPPPAPKYPFMAPNRGPSLFRRA